MILIFIKLKSALNALVSKTLITLVVSYLWYQFNVLWLLFRHVSQQFNWTRLVKSQLENQIWRS